MKFANRYCPKCGKQTLLWNGQGWECKSCGWKPTTVEYIHTPSKELENPKG